MPGRPWTEEEIKRAHDMRAAGYPYGAIDRMLRRRAGATQRRFEVAGHGWRHETSHRIPDVLSVEREALMAARNQRTLTQDFRRDPPPGYSALRSKTGLR